ncbi:D-alanyl-D-alanine carboxypeptidase [Desulfosporosinus sp. PR]|uniref:D-alanyl-D-alanine carboxypeptidase family protein n=1 Tax=Candidatus Desulfosporosinus nitrosoreducens TaxID=3401928 RepID=UPI0027E7808F|nr:D-alanyl-D-alanine carboxypeptidase [Desulfosporosinus sp. PR]MDQ7093400.1 D-alanyl-D-alanine carboxypeptidase [Desulfosporosinus sp. PR]
MTVSPKLKTSKTRSPKPKGPLILLIVILIIVAGIVQVSRSYPDIEVKPLSQDITLPGQLSVSFPDQGESAVGTENLGVVAASDQQISVPIASLTKMMTAYLVLKEHPLKPGEDGPSLTINAQDLADYQNGVKNGYSVLPVAQGETLSERQLLEGLMLPSGDNIATTLARWVSGTEAAFVTKMNETAKSLSMKDTHYDDPSGVSTTTVSSAVDQIKIAQAAMEDPVFQEIVAMPQATLPVAGTVYNVNSMLGKHGVVGIKTGSTTPAGGCFVSATPVVVGKEKHFIIAAVLGQKTAQSLQSALESNVQILDQVRSQFKLYPVTPPAGFGQVTSAWNSSSDLKTSQAIQVFGYPGMKVTLSITNVKTGLPINANENVATLKISAGSQTQTVKLSSTKPIQPPSILWKLIRY